MDEVIRPVTEAELRDFSALILAVFDRDIAPHLSLEGVRTFHENAAYQNRLALAEGQVLLACYAADAIIGALRLAPAGHLYNLFVDSEHQRRGIGRRLIAAGVAALAARGLNPPTLTLNASPNAVAAYLRMGFVVDGPEDTRGGIRNTPMRIETARVR